MPLFYRERELCCATLDGPGAWGEENVTMTTALSLEARYKAVMERVAAAAKRSGRAPRDILVVAVSKYAEFEQIRELIELGHRDFGESRVQQMEQRAAIIEEMMGRKRELPSVGLDDVSPLFPNDEPVSPGTLPSVRWHMIGTLQRNKTRKCIETARIIHSIDSLRSIEEVQSVAYKLDRVVELLVQVNCTGEPQKGGCAVPAALHMCEQIDSLVHLRVRGLMTMGPTSQDPDETREAFTRCAEVFSDIRPFNLADGRFNILSMGMSNDYETAIECGANMVRIGSDIFGEPASTDEETETD